MRHRYAIGLFLAGLGASLPSFAGDSVRDQDDIDSIGLSLALPFGGERSGQSWLQRAEPSLNLGMSHYEPLWRPCEDSCQQRPSTPRAYSLSLIGLVEAASLLQAQPQQLQLQLGRWRELLLEPAALSDPRGVPGADR